jgi:hypothetical protein
VELRASVRALREELERAVGTPPAAPPKGTAAREQLEAELASEKKKLADIQAGVEGGVDLSTVAEAVGRSETRIAELETRLAALPSGAPASAPSLYELKAEISRMQAEFARSRELSAAPATMLPAPKSPPTDAEGSDKDAPMVGLLPLNFTAFGDFYYRTARSEADNFHIGAVELDASLKLTHYVIVSTAILYSGEADKFALPAFVIDCGLFGEGEQYPIASKVVTKSGVSFGRFDVPFGIAYLEYPSVNNRLVTSPQAVAATHGNWNDTGAQAYALAEHWSALAYIVNGPEKPIDAATTEPSWTAIGGRLSGKFSRHVEVGGSFAGHLGRTTSPMTYAGADLTTTVGSLDVRGEYLLRHVDAPGVESNTHGAYLRAVMGIEPAFLLARYDTVLSGGSTLDRRVTAGAAVEVFPQGEVRAIWEQSFSSDVRAVTLQLVGGSTFQPTGLRR